ncbi:MAG: cobalt ECF transporter T component CbiQ [Dehalococcoidales bacterium]|jgi:cobalt/nickel transport system permease protein|nr:cobalt ECF transporter T component CbiQ [Dehalococcoidales bacterium]
MSHKDKLFSDVFVHRENLVTRIEARTKISFTVVALVINLLSPTIYTPIAIALFCLATLIAVGIPPKLLGLRLAMPLVMAGVVLITQIFFYGTTTLFILPVLGFNLVGYEEGLARGLLIMYRVIGGVSLILFLSMSTPMNKLLMAATWFQAPKIFVELALLVYRYIFVLLEEIVTVKDAQRIRLGYHNWRQSMRSLGVLGGSLILRTYDRAERVFEAMIARGYSGTVTVSYSEHFGRKDFITAVCLSAILVILYLIGQWRA